MRVTVVMFALFACGTDPKPGDTDTEAVVDSDAPVEQCNGADDDGDGDTDEGVTVTWLVDADEDGAPGTLVSGCEAPVDAPTVATDCDDEDPTRHPGAQERCDGTDRDCNGTPDDLAFSWDFQADVDPATVVLLGDAAQASGAGGQRFLRLTDTDARQTSAVWLLPRLPWPALKVQARIFVTANDGEHPGEGMALVLIEDGTTDLIGEAGPELGAYGIAATGLVVELDNSLAASGEDQTHLAVHTLPTGERLATSTERPGFDDGVWHDLEVRVQGGLVDVSLDGAAVITAQPVSLADDRDLLLGFTAATSNNRYQGHRVDDVTFGCP